MVQNASSTSPKLETFLAIPLGPPLRALVSCLHNFLYQILLGAELLLCPHKELITTSYASLITDYISELIVISSLWMQNVVVASTPPASSSTTIPAPALHYTLYATQNARQAQGLIRFGEELSWP